MRDYETARRTTRPPPDRQLIEEKQPAWRAAFKAGDDEPRAAMPRVRTTVPCAKPLPMVRSAG